MTPRIHRAIISAQLTRQNDVTSVEILSITHDDPRKPPVFDDIDHLFIEQFPFDGDKRVVTVFATSDETDDKTTITLEHVSLRHLRALGYANVTS